MRYALAAVILLLSTMTCEARLRAGAAVADITPEEWPIRVVGNFGLTLAKSAHDKLHARALVLDDGGVRIAVAVVDSCYVKRREMDRIKVIASKDTGIPQGRILLAATHTHSAPPSAAEVGNEIERRYVERFVVQTATAIKQANANLKPARIGWSVISVPDELFNRRWFVRDGAIRPNPFGETTDLVRMNPPGGSPDLIHPAGGTDPGLSIVSVRDDGGKPLAVLANYSLHYVGGVPGPEVSADYFGAFAEALSKRIAPDDASFTAILTNGTSGDVNNIDFVHPRPPAEPYQRIGVVSNKLADKVADAAGRIQYQADVPMRMIERELPLRYRRGTPAQLAFAQHALQQKDDTGLPQNAKAYAERLMEMEKGPEVADVKLQAIRIGELGIAAIPCETFTETGLTIKELSPFPTTFTMELSNGHYGYLPTPRHFDLGGYETWPGTNYLERDASAKITRTLLELLQRLHGSK